MSPIHIIDKNLLPSKSTHLHLNYIKNVTTTSWLVFDQISWNNSLLKLTHTKNHHDFSQTTTYILFSAYTLAELEWVILCNISLSWPYTILLCLECLPSESECTIYKLCWPDMQICVINIILFCIYLSETYLLLE